MIELSDKELNNIEGGAAVSTCVGIGLVVSSIVIFLSGLIRGYTNPEGCNVKEN